MVSLAPLLIGSFAFNFNNFILVEFLTQGGPPILDATVPVGAMDVTLYRDDLMHTSHWPEVQATEMPFSIEGKHVVLVDDVMYTGRSARAEEQLATARATRADLQNQKAKMEGQLQLFADRMDMGQVDMPTERIEAMADESALQLDLLKRQIKAMDQEIVELENALKRYQRDLDDWQSLIDRRLSDY